MTLNLSNFTRDLRDKLSPESRILIDAEDAEFKASCERWSNIDLKIPGAVFRPAIEKDVVIIVSCM